MNNEAPTPAPLPEDGAQPAARKPYETPSLTKHGTVRDLTLNSGLSGTDNPNGTPPVGSHP